jgi:menaquinol-cytochrome c reductase iron-sulfur subunit
MTDKTDEKKISRKKFMLKLSLGLAGACAAVAAIPVISALLAPILETKKAQWRSVGNPEGFEIGSTSLVNFTNADPEPYAGVTAQSAAWLRRTDKDNFIAFAVNCSHLGCPVRWEAQAELFMCPCHGGVYYKDGTVAAGPPPNPLTKYDVRVSNGQVQIKTASLPFTA